MRIIPRGHSCVCAPSLKVEWITPLKNHSINTARATQNLAATVSYTATVHVRLGLRRVHPVVKLASDRKHQGCWHMNKHVKPLVGTASLKNENRIIWIGTQTVSQRATSRAATHNYVVERFLHGLFISQ